MKELGFACLAEMKAAVSTGQAAGLPWGAERGWEKRVQQSGAAVSTGRLPERLSLAGGVREFRNFCKMGAVRWCSLCVYVSIFDILYYFILVSSIWHRGQTII